MSGFQGWNYWYYVIDWWCTSPTCQGRRRHFKSGTAIEQRWCSPSAEGTRGGGERGREGGWPPSRKGGLGNFRNSRWLKQRFCCTLRPFLLVNFSLFYRRYCYISNAYHSLFRLPPPPTTTKISITISTPRWISSGGGIKGNWFFKMKVTFKSDTDIPAIFSFRFVFYLFVLFIFFLSYFFIYCFLFLFFLSFFGLFFLFLSINLSTCNRIYILTRAQHSQASK